MEEYKILVTPPVHQQLNDLINILYQANYFSNYDNAVNYVNDLIDKIKHYLPILKPKQPRFHRPEYGKNAQYVTIRKNKYTSYIIFFLQKGNTYIITYIGNNHTDGHHI
jgi:hypothetical protein